MMEGMRRRDALALLGAYHAVHVVIDRSQVGRDGDAERMGDCPVDAGGGCGHRAKRRRRREGGITEHNMDAGDGRGSICS
jgi:hypothetical protein